MAGRTARRKSCQLLLILWLLNISAGFEVREDEWEELRPDVAALHRLSGLSEHLEHQQLSNDSQPSSTRVRRSVTRLEIDQNILSLRDGLQECENMVVCVMAKKQDLGALVEDVEKQKTDDWLLTASEISHSYGQKLLIITDQEPSTSERARQEYIMDPHYSVIVHVESLNNESCVPKVDRNTVVRIFGHVSEDGQTISGLSGSSLADLILKPGLEAAAVFSLDGNTSTEFQHSFVRVLMVRGSKAALETVQDNHQIYKIQEQSDSVSTYKIPKRPVDHSTQYDHQQIIMLQDNPVVRTAAESLYEKHPTVSSLYVLDNNLKPRLIHGEPVSLSENSRLVLVGHAARDQSGEMKLAGFKSSEVTKIIQNTHRLSDQIKTTSVVACDVGSDESFVETLAKELHQAGIETELHLRNSLVQVKHTGEKITQEFTVDGEQWRHQDNSKKVVATIDKNGDVIIRSEAGSKGEAIFTSERNFLGSDQDNRYNWPEEPRRFIDQNIYKKIDQNNPNKVKSACDELEAMSWGLFHPEQEKPAKVNINNHEHTKEQYVIMTGAGNNIVQINKQQKIKEILHNCYEIKSGKDAVSLIRHYAKTGETDTTYLKIRDWIFKVDPKTLYMIPAGKLVNTDNRGEVKTLITKQNGQNKDKYLNIRGSIQNKQKYANYVRDIFKGNPISQNLSLREKLFYAWYFAASVVAESARNFRTFPLTLMALDLIRNGANNKYRLKFLFKNHPMARGDSWSNSRSRGFSGTAEVPQTHPYYQEKSKTLPKVIRLELSLFNKWRQTVGNNLLNQFFDLTVRYNINTEYSQLNNNYQQFKDALQHQSSLIPPTDVGEPPASGTLSGHDDGYVTQRDITSASELENSFKHEAYFSRGSALLAEDIHTQLTKQFGENLAGMHVRKGSNRIDDGQFICQLEFNTANNEPVEFRADLSAKTQKFHKELQENMDRSVQEMEEHSLTSSHQGSKQVEHVGSAVGVLGLLLGMKGFIRTFEQGHVKDGVVGALQTAHGTTAIASSAIARTALSSEGRAAKAAVTIMRSPVMKGTMTAIPIIGIGFGIYNVEEDFKRKDTLGYIDGAFDTAMVALDVVELGLLVVAPELAPEVALTIALINVELSVVRMVDDDIYMGIKNELDSLPKDASVLRKIVAAFAGFRKSVRHFGIRVVSSFYDWHYDEIEEGRRLVAQISDYRKYYVVTKETDGVTAIDFSGGESSWNGGGIDFCLADGGQSRLCMDYFVSSDESFERRCWNISNTQGSTDIILGTGESHELEHTTLQKKVLLFIPAGSVTVVSGYKDASYSLYGTYRGNRDSNRFFAVQNAGDTHMIEVMLSYYYRLYGEPGDDTFFLGPQRTYVEGSGGKDTYLIPENGGKTIINNFDPSKATDTLHFSVDYRDISVFKSGDDVVLMYQSTHSVTIKNWFLGELYHHMIMMSGDGVLFEISSTVVTSVQLVATGINKMFQTLGGTINAADPPLHTVIDIVGTQSDDIIIGNDQNNLIDGGGGTDRLSGGEGEDIYNINGNSKLVMIENFSRDRKTDLAIIDSNLQSFDLWVEGDDVILKAVHDNTPIYVTLVNWFRSQEDRHLLIITKHLITFTISDNVTDCLLSNKFLKCIKLQSIDYSSSSSPLVVDLLADAALNSLTEVHGSKFDDVIKGNDEHNVFIPGDGDDFMQGRGGEDWYVITPGGGEKIINNQSPDQVLDKLYLKERYESLTAICELENIVILVNRTRTVVLQNWFLSEVYQHLEIRTSDGVTAGLKTNTSSCDEALIQPFIIDYRNQIPDNLRSSKQQCCYTTKHSVRLFCGPQGKEIINPPFRNLLLFIFQRLPGCLFQEDVVFALRWLVRCRVTQRPIYSQDMILNCVRNQPYMRVSHELIANKCRLVPERLQTRAREWNRYDQPTYCQPWKDIMMKETDSVKEMFGSSGFDIMVGNKNDNLLDPYTGGAVMSGGEGGDTYVIKHGYGDKLFIDNFAEDQRTDTVLVDMDFIDGGQVVLVSSTKDLGVTIKTEGEELKFSLINYRLGDQHQHLDFLSSDGVRFKLKSMNSSGDAPQFQVEAFNVTLKQSEVDCRLDLSTQRNLSKVQTAQGCPSQSNYMIGNNQDNVLIGGWKDDALDGGEGDDTLIGGYGADILVGGMGDDTLYGEDGNDTMLGGSGRDVFVPGPGPDLVDGGSGRDTVLYRGDHEKGSGVYVNLLSGQGHYADAEGDVLKDVEAVIGTIYSDILVSGYESSLLKSSDGNDILVSTGGDYLVGGDGNDIYMLAFDHGSVTIDNCAKDNATDVLYFNSHSLPSFDHQFLPDRIVLTLFGPNQTAVKVGLKGWRGDASECGHLKLVFREVEISVDRILTQWSPTDGSGDWSGDGGPIGTGPCKK